MFNHSDVPYLKAVSLADPAPGVDWAITAPGQGIWRVLALSGLLTTSAAVANRVPSLILSTSDGIMSVAPPGAAITAGLAVRLSSFPGAGTVGAAAGPQLWSAPTAGFTLLPGWSLSVVTDAIDVTDQWTLLRALVVEYPTGPNVRITPDVPSFLESAR